MGSFSLAHWLIVIVVLLLIFGPKRLSEVGKGLGQGIRNFKKGMEGEEAGREGDADAEERPKRLKGESERPAKRLKPARDEDDRDRDDAEEEEEEVRPSKKSRRV